MTNDESDNLISFKWNNHQTTFFEVLANLRAKDIYTDVTLACEHHFVSAHKLVLSSCSDYFKEIFARSACISPVIVLKDIRIRELDALIDYMYLGEADVKESEVPGILRAAECLKIKGLGVPDEHSNFFQSPASCTVETEYATPTKKIKQEEKNVQEKWESQNNKQRLPSTVKEERKRKESKDNFPLLTNALKAAKVARLSSNGIKFAKSHFRNRALINRNSSLAKSNREIKVIALPSSGKKVDLMTLPINDQELEYNDSEQLGIDSRVIHSSNSSSSLSPVNKEHIKDIVIDCHKDASQSNSDLSHYENNMDFEDSEASLSELHTTNAVSKLHIQQQNMQHGEMSSITSDNSSKNKGKEISVGKNVQKYNIMEEDESDKLKLPNFSSVVEPYLNGEAVSSKLRCQLRSCVVGQLIKHFFNLDEQILKEPNFYSDLETLLIETYPNIVEDKCKKRSGQLGSLISLMKSEHKKAMKKRNH